jgi:hypothetical protein
MRCWILIQIWTIFALQTPQDALDLSFVGCRRVSTHAARDNQPAWIAAGSVALAFVAPAARLFAGGKSQRAVVADPTIRFLAFEARSSKDSAPWTTTKKKSMIFGQVAVIKSAHNFAISESCFMDVMIFLKLAPAVIGIAGLLTYFMMRAREPVPDLELAKIVQRVRNTFLLLGCVALIMLSVWLIQRSAPPDHDTSLSGLAAGVSHIESAL